MCVCTSDAGRVVSSGPREIDHSLLPSLVPDSHTASKVESPYLHWLETGVEGEGWRGWVWEGKTSFCLHLTGNCLSICNTMLLENEPQQYERGR